MNFPGFHFCPEADEGLIKLSVEERTVILTNLGYYSAPLYLFGNDSDIIDLKCNLDNLRIPTHREVNTEAPKYHAFQLHLLEATGCPTEIINKLKKNTIE